MVGGPRRVDRVAQQQEASHFIPHDRVCRKMSVGESVQVQELESHRYISKHPMGLGARQGALLEHFAQKQAWHRFAHGVKMFQSCPGAHPSVQVRRLDLAVLLCPEQAWWPILDFRGSQTFIGQGHHPDGFRRECRPSGPGSVLPFVPAGSTLGFQRADDSNLA